MGGSIRTRMLKYFCVLLLLNPAAGSSPTPSSGAVSNTSSLSCENFVLWPGTAICDGNGVCVADPATNASRCKCDEGWEGASDLTTFSRVNEACDVHTTVVKVLWGILAVGCAATSSIVFRAVVIEFRGLSKRSSSGRRGSKKKTSGLANNSASAIVHLKLINLCFFGFSELFFAVIAIVKISLPLDQTRLGTNTFCTTLFGMAVLLVYCGCSGFIATFALMGYQLSGTWNQETANRMVRLRYVIAAVVAYSLLPTLVAPLLILADTANAQIYASASYVGIAILIFMNARMLPMALDPVLDILSTSTKAARGSSSLSAACRKKQKKKKDPISQTMARIRFTKAESLKTALQNLVIAPLFSIPYFTAKASYQLPVVWLTANLIALFVVQCFTPQAMPGYKKKLQQASEIASDS